MSDYYSTLGVDKTASTTDIKKAYRKLAREWHPDVAKDKPGAETKFKEINEAYQVLSDTQKRKQYDQFGSTAFGGGAGGGGDAGADGFNPFSGGSGQGPSTWTYSTSSGGSNQGFEDPFDIFEQVFGFRGFGGRRKGRNVRYSLTIDFVDAIKGFEKNIQIDGHKLKIKLPIGVREGTQIKFAGKGEDPGQGLPLGDLYVSIHVNPHPKFARQGSDVFTIAEIDMVQAALGDKIAVKVIDPLSNTGFSEKKVKIPTGTQPGTQIRLKGYGMPSTRGLGRGNLYLNIKVNIPKRLSKKQRKALEDLGL